MDAFEQGYNSARNGVDDDPFTRGYNQARGAQQQAIPTGNSSWFERGVVDPAAALASGALKLPSVVTGLADIPTGGAVGRGAKWLGEQTGFQPEKWSKQLWDANVSPETQAAVQKVNRADGFWNTVGTALENPSAISNAVFESLPGTIAGGLGGAAVARRGVEGIAARQAAGELTEEAAKAAMRRQIAIGAGVGEGAITAGNISNDIGQDPNAGYFDRWAAIPAGIITGAIGAGVANKFGDVTSQIAAKRLGVDVGSFGGAGRFGNAVRGAFSEGVMQELPQSWQEQVWTNLGQGRPWDEGLGNAAAQGMLAGMGMGAGFGAAHGGRSSPEAIPTPQDLTQSGAQQQQQAIAALPAPTVAPTPGMSTVGDWAGFSGETMQQVMDREANRYAQEAAVRHAERNNEALWAARNQHEQQANQVAPVVTEGGTTTAAPATEVNPLRATFDSWVESVRAAPEAQRPSDSALKPGAVETFWKKVSEGATSEEDVETKLKEVINNRRSGKNQRDMAEALVEQIAQRRATQATEPTVEAEAQPPAATPTQTTEGTPLNVDMAAPATNQPQITPASATAPTNQPQATPLAERLRTTDDTISVLRDAPATDLVSALVSAPDLEAKVKEAVSPRAWQMIETDLALARGQATKTVAPEITEEAKQEAPALRFARLNTEDYTPEQREAVQQLLAEVPTNSMQVLQQYQEGMTFRDIALARLDAQQQAAVETPKEVLAAMREMVKSKTATPEQRTEAQRAVAAHTAAKKQLDSYAEVARKQYEGLRTTLAAKGQQLGLTRDVVEQLFPRMDRQTKQGGADVQTISSAEVAELGLHVPGQQAVTQDLNETDEVASLTDEVAGMGDLAADENDTTGDEAIKTETPDDDALAAPDVADVVDEKRAAAEVTENGRRRSAEWDALSERDQQAAKDAWDDMTKGARELPDWATLDDRLKAQFYKLQSRYYNDEISDSSVFGQGSEPGIMGRSFGVNFAARKLAEGKVSVSGFSSVPASRRNALMRVLWDLQVKGYPIADVLDSVVAVEKTNDDGWNAVAIKLPSGKYMVMVSPKLLAKNEWHFRKDIYHEIAHALDDAQGGRIHSSDPLLNLGGAVYNELKALYNAKRGDQMFSEFVTNFLHNPFKLNLTPEKTANELFAQIMAAYHIDPVGLNEYAPLAYDLAEAKHGDIQTNGRGTAEDTGASQTARGVPSSGTSLGQDQAGAEPDARHQLGPRAQEALVRIPKVEGDTTTFDFVVNPEEADLVRVMRDIARNEGVPPEEPTPDFSAETNRLKDKLKLGKLQRIERNYIETFFDKLSGWVLESGADLARHARSFLPKTKDVAAKVSISRVLAQYPKLTFINFLTVPMDVVRVYELPEKKAKEMSDALTRVRERRIDDIRKTVLTDMIPSDHIVHKHNQASTAAYQQISPMSRQMFVEMAQTYAPVGDTLRTIKADNEYLPLGEVSVKMVKIFDGALRNGKSPRDAFLIAYKNSALASRDEILEAAGPDKTGWIFFPAEGMTEVSKRDSAKALYIATSDTGGWGQSAWCVGQAKHFGESYLSDSYFAVYFDKGKSTVSARVDRDSNTLVEWSGSAIIDGKGQRVPPEHEHLLAEGAAQFGFTIPDTYIGKAREAATEDMDSDPWYAGLRKALIDAHNGNRKAIEYIATKVYRTEEGNDYLSRIWGYNNVAARALSSAEEGVDPKNLMTVMDGIMTLAGRTAVTYGDMVDSAVPISKGASESVKEYAESLLPKGSRGTLSIVKRLRTAYENDFGGEDSLVEASFASHIKSFVKTLSARGFESTAESYEDVGGENFANVIRAAGAEFEKNRLASTQVVTIPMDADISDDGVDTVYVTTVEGKEFTVPIRQFLTAHGVEFTPGYAAEAFQKMFNAGFDKAFAREVKMTVSDIAGKIGASKSKQEVVHEIDVKPDFSRDFYTDSNGRQQPTYMKRITGMTTDRSGRNSFHVIGKFGPIQNAAIGFQVTPAEGFGVEYKLEIYDADLLPHVQQARARVETFMLDIQEDGLAAVHTSGVDPSSSAVISKYGHLLRREKTSYGEYIKFDEGVFPKRDIRDAFRMVRDFADSEGNLDNVDTLRISRATGATAGLPPRYYSREQMMDFSRDAVTAEGKVIADDIKSMLTTGFLQVPFLNDLAAFAKRLLPGIQQFADLISEKSAIKRDLELKIQAVLSEFGKLSSLEQKVAKEYMLDATMSNVWGYQPSWRTDKVTTTPQAEAKWRALPNDKVRSVVDSVFKHGYDTLKAKREVINKEITAEYDSLLEAVRANPSNFEAGTEEQLLKERKEALRKTGTFLASVTGPYVSLRRFGDFVVVWRSAELQQAIKDKDTKRVDELERDADHYRVVFKDSMGLANRLRDQWIAEGKQGAEAFKKVEWNRALDEMPFATMQRIKGKLEGMDDSRAAGALNRLLTDMYIQMLAEGSSRKGEMARRLVSGFDAEDMMKSFALQSEADAHFISALQMNAQVQEALNGLRREASKGEGSSADRNMRNRVLNEVLARYSAMMDVSHTPIQNALMAMNSVWYLLTSPAFYMQQITQPFLMSQPMIAARIKSGNRAFGELIGAFKEMVSKGMLRDMARNYKGGEVVLDIARFNKVGDENAMLESLRRFGLIDTGIDTDLGYLRADNPLGKALGSVTHKLGLIARNAEILNRVGTALAAYRPVYEMAIKEGKAPEIAHGKAAQFAREVVEQTHGNYSGFNAPGFMHQSRYPGLPVKATTQFRKFQIIQISMLARQAANAFFNKEATEDEKMVARATLRWVFTNYAAMTGALGLPLVSLLGLFGGDDEPKDLEYKLRKSLEKSGVSKEVTNILLHGLPSVAGLNTTTKFGMGNTFSLLPFTDVDLTKKQGVAELSLALMGPAGGLATKFADGIGLIGKGDHWKGYEMLVPRGIGDGMKALRYAEKGVTNRAGDTLLKPEEITAWNAALQAVGLAPAKIQHRQWQQGVAIEFSQDLQTRAKDLTHRYASAYKEGDRKEQDRIVQEWRKLNDIQRKNGMIATPIGNLFKAPAAQRKREIHTVDGLQYKRGDRQFIADLADT